MTARKIRTDDARQLVCVIGLRGIPDVMGGIETHCENLYPRLSASLRDRCRFVVLARRQYVTGDRQHRGVAVVPIYAPRNKYLETIVHSIYAVFYARFKLHASIVHIHAIGPSLVAPLAILTGMKVIVTHHGEDYRRAKWNALARTALKVGERIAIASADEIISISRSLQARLTRRFPRRKHITFIPNGVSLAESSGAGAGTIARFGLEKGRYILGVGRLVPEKGFQDLIAAYEGMRPSGERPKLVIVGEADHNDAFARSLLERQSDDVIFTGRLSRTAVYDFYANAALFVLPSYHEGLPFVALEAIAAGAPAILSDIEGNRELDLPDSNYFRPGDVTTLRGLLERRSDAFTVNGADVLGAYDWDGIASRTVAVYQSILPPTP